MAFRKVLNFYHTYGLKATIRKVWETIRKKGIKNVAQEVTNTKKIDINSFYGFIMEKERYPFVQEEYEAAKDGPYILNWVIPEMGVGSGGHINILRFVKMLQKQGIKNRIYVENPINIRSDEELRAFLRANYDVNPDEIELYNDAKKMHFAHGTVATGWQTSYIVNRFDNTLRKFYFVQDFEPYFAAPGSEYKFAEKSYTFGFYGITAGDWLKEKLHREYKMETSSVGFSYDRSLYKPVQKKDEVKRIFFYARPVTVRRAFELGLLALTELYHRMPDIEVIFGGWDVANYEIPFIHLNGGSIKLSELSDIYGQCDMCLVLSGTNLSLLPLEVMASNSVVVSNRGENNEWLLNEDNAILTDFDPMDIADKMEYYFNHKDELEKIRKNGLEFAQQTNWETEGKKAYEAFVRGIKEAEEKIIL